MNCPRDIPRAVPRLRPELRVLVDFLADPSELHLQIFRHEHAEALRGDFPPFRTSEVAMLLHAAEILQHLFVDRADRVVDLLALPSSNLPLLVEEVDRVHRDRRREERAEENGQQILDLTQLCVTLDGIRGDDGEKD